MIFASISTDSPAIARLTSSGFEIVVPFMPLILVYTRVFPSNIVNSSSIKSLSSFINASVVTTVLATTHPTFLPSKESGRAETAIISLPSFTMFFVLVPLIVCATKLAVASCPYDGFEIRFPCVS